MPNKEHATNAVNKIGESAPISQTAKDVGNKATIATSNAATTSTSTKDTPHKSPIPNRNTQKFVSQFADLHLTGGCMSSPSTSPATMAPASDSPNAQQMMTSFKPQIKVKPPTLRKPLVLPPTTPEMTRRTAE